MATRMTGLCEKGAALIWKQCNEELFPRGVTYLEEAAYAGDADAWYFLGHCYSQGDGAVGFNEKKAYDCYYRGAAAGSFRAVLGAVRTGFYDEKMKQAALCSEEESREQLREAAEKGDAYAAFQMADASEWGMIPEEEETDSDSEKAGARCLPWYRKAAEGGIVKAMVKLGQCCQNGQYMEKNPEQYLDWAEKAASVGDVWGLSQMGEYYQSYGELEAAAAYLEAAAKQGAAKAPLLLGQMYLNGEGIQRDLSKAVKYLELAASREEADSYLLLGALFYNDELVEREDEKAFYWYGRAYEAGKKEAAVPLAHLYLRTSEIQNRRTAEALLKEAVETETDGRAALALGNISRDGLCGEMDLEQAIHWYEKGAKQGNPECMELLGCLYFQGEEGIDTDYGKAFYWLNLCLEAGTLQSCSKLAYLYMKGEGCEKDEEKAIELFERAARTEYDGNALYELGYLYENRGENPENLEKAADYYQKAIEMGNENAVRRFSHFKKSLFGRWKLVP